MYAKLARRNIRRSIHDYAIYFLTLLFGVCIFYAFNSITQQSAVLTMSAAQNTMIQLLAYIIGYVSIFVAIILGFLVVYANRYLIRRRKREFAIYLTLGMNRSHVSRIIIFETALIGLVSLVVGLVLGYLLSQGLLFVTAALFDVKMNMFTFFFSPEAAIKTVACFVIIFLITLIFNISTVSRYQLIDLLNADRKNERVTLRSLPLTIILFIVSLGLIGTAYHLLIDNGLTSFDGEFAWSTALVCIGTFLFFYSLSGILLRLVQKNPRLYLKGLNMFTLRQLNNKVNTAWISISVVALALFIALTGTCGGFGIVTVFNSSLERATPYDASYEAYLGHKANTAAAADNYNMETAFARDVSGWNTMVSKTAQIDVYRTDDSLQSLLDTTNYTFSNSLYTEEMGSSPLYVVPLSDLNNLRALNGLTPLELGDNQFIVWCDFDEMTEFWKAYLTQNSSITLLGKTLSPKSTDIETVITQTAPMAMNTGILVVPDADIPSDSVAQYSILDVMFNGPRSEIDTPLSNAVAAAYENAQTKASGWPMTSGFTAIEAYEQNSALRLIVSYLAIYIGVILLITCAAILALQQLSEASDNIDRYGLIRKLGAEQRMINHALYIQIGIYFIFPLVVALAHSICAMSVVVNVLRLYDSLNITGPLVITTLLVAVLYGGYFIATCYLSHGVIFSRETSKTRMIQ